MGIVVARTFTVTAAADAVLEYFTDFGNTDEWDPGTLETTRVDPGRPIAVGTRWHNRSRILGVTTELTYTLCAVENDRVVFMGRNEGATSTGTVTVRPVGGGTEVTYHVDLEIHGLAKLATPVMKIEFEKLGNAVQARLTSVLNRLSSAA
jgi:carbon monoxide dehydrogenase subunit G